MKYDNINTLYLNPNLHVSTPEAYKLLHDGIFTLQRMEQQGLRINLKYIEKKNKEIASEVENLEKQFMATKFYRRWAHYNKTAVNIYSPQQLGAYLYNSLKLRIPKTTDSGEGSTDEETLLELGIPELKLLVRAKKLKKAKATYFDGLSRESVNHFVHPFFNLHLVRTFRGSVDTPNLQNIPKRDAEIMDIVRGAIYPRKGHQLVEIDFSQLEVRVAACYHKDPMMIRYIEDKTTDMHRDMAQQLFKLKKFDKEITGHGTLRQAAKNGFVFPEFYGSYYGNCAANLACTWGGLSKHNKWEPGQGIEFGKGFLSDHMLKHGFKELGKHEKVDGKWTTTGFIKYVKDVEDDFWKNRFKVYSQWKDDWYAEYEKNGFFKSFTGFTYQGLMSKNDAVNYPIQGSAFHILLWSLIQGMNAQVREKWQTKIVNQIHDAVILDVHPTELKKIVPIMKCIMMNDVRQHWKWISVPLDVEVTVFPVDKSWACKDKIIM